MRKTIHDCANPRNDDDYAIIARTRLKDLRIWFKRNGWDELPQGERPGRLQWIADHAWVAYPTNPKPAIRRRCREIAPDLSDDDLDQLIAYTEQSNKRWTPDQSAMVWDITAHDRDSHALWSFGACDDPDYEWRRNRNLEKDAERKRNERAARSTGRPRGRPRLELTPEEMKARRNAQAAERMRRLRLRKNASATKEEDISRTELSVTAPSPILLLPAPIVPARAPKARGGLPVTVDVLEPLEGEIVTDDVDFDDIMMHPSLQSAIAYARRLIQKERHQ
jgi:hypothetical protein